MSDEMLDLVDSQDIVIGQKLRSEIYSEKLTGFRVVNAFIQNDHGKLWIPRRSPSKRVFPRCLDASMGGHVSSGESYQQAFERELFEELRIDASTANYRELGIMTPHQHNVSAFMRVFLLKSNLVPDYNKEDFVEFFWLSPEEVLFALEHGDRGKGDLAKMIRHFFVVR